LYLDVAKFQERINMVGRLAKDLLKHGLGIFPSLREIGIKRFRIESLDPFFFFCFFLLLDMRKAPVKEEISRRMTFGISYDWSLNK